MCFGATGGSRSSSLLGKEDSWRESWWLSSTEFAKNYSQESWKVMCVVWSGCSHNSSGMRGGLDPSINVKQGGGAGGLERSGARPNAQSLPCCNRTSRRWHLL